jgi:hypothetical protein
MIHVGVDREDAQRTMGWHDSMLRNGTLIHTKLECSDFLQAGIWWRK